MSEVYTKEFVKLVNDWQKGYSLKKKQVLGEQLKFHTAALEEKFRTCESVCYRSYGLPPANIYSLHVTRLTESISSWTTDINVAKDFKGGITAKFSGYHSIIVEHMPRPEQVILNFSVLYSDDEFLKACESYRSELDLASGIFQYSNRQQEVILEVEEITIDSIFAYGGYGNDLAALAKSGNWPYGKRRLKVFLQHTRGSKFSPPTKWVEGSMKDTVIEKMKQAVISGRYKIKG